MKPTMKKLTCLFVFALSICSIGFSQASNSSYSSSSYNSAIGIRLGTGYFDLVSASFKTFLNSSPGALELNLGIKQDNYIYDAYYDTRSEFSVSFAASYQYHFDITSVLGLRWFVGGGAIISSTSHYGFGMGLFPVGGVDYKFSNIPLNLSADIRPVFAVVNPYSDHYNSIYPDFGVSARFTFK